MSKFNTAMTDAMEALDAEIADVEKELEQLRATRSNLETVLVEDDGDSPKRERKSSTIKVTDKPRRTSGKESTKRERIVHMLQDGVKVSEIADEVDVTTNYIYTIRKAEGLDKDTASGSKRGRRSSNGNGNGTRKVTKRQQIRDMLDDGMSVRDIAAELKISPGYVYNVRNS